VAKVYKFLLEYLKRKYSLGDLDLVGDIIKINCKLGEYKGRDYNELVNDKNQWRVLVKVSNGTKEFQYQV
jgi:hypothetical protein